MEFQDAARYAIQQDFSLAEADEYWKEQERSFRKENMSNEILDEETIDKLIDCEYDAFREKIEPNLLKHYQRLCSERMESYIEYILKHNESSAYERCIEWICDQLEEKEIRYLTGSQQLRLSGRAKQDMSL